MAKSTKSRRSNKPQKPYAEFPLFTHQTGRWAKKICQKMHYFGRIADDPEGTKAVEKLNREWPYLKDGRTPPPVDAGDHCTVKVLCNAFLDSKLAKLNAGELSRESFSDYKRSTDLLIAHFADRRVDDLRPDDFERLRSALAQSRGAVALRNVVNRMRVVLKYAFDQRLIDRPAHFGQSFNRPSAKSIRQSRNEAGPRMFTAAELRQILDGLNGVEVEAVDHDSKQPKKVTLKADRALRAMVLMGVNCGFGNTDVASLQQSAIDLASGWVEFPRPKTAIQRRVPLWPETVEALRSAIAVRPTPKDSSDAGLCFLSVQGRRWVRVEENSEIENKFHRRDNVANRFQTLLHRLGINGRKRLGFYTLRRVFETIGGESRDQVAVDAIMGHVDTSMAAQYREGISDERLQAVVGVVRTWLWPVETALATNAKPKRGNKRPRSRNNDSAKKPRLKIVG